MTSNKSWADMTEDGDVLTKSTDSFRFSTDTYNSPDDAAAAASFSSDPIPVDIPKPKATVTQPKKKEEPQHATQSHDVHAIPQHHYGDQHDHRDRDYPQHRNRDDQHGQERGHPKNNYQKPNKQRGNNKNDNYNHHHHTPHSPNPPHHHQQAPHSPQQFPPYPPQQFPNVVIPTLTPSPVIKPVKASSGAGLLDPASGHQYGSPNPLSPNPNPLRGFHELSPKVAPRGAPEGLVPVTVLKAPGFGGPPGFDVPSFGGGRGHDDFGGGRGHDNFGRGHDNFGGRGGGSHRGGRGGRGRNQNYGHDDRGPRESAPADTSFGRGGARGAPSESEYGFQLGAER